jgi:hypothetical protein
VNNNFKNDKMLVFQCVRNHPMKQLIRLTHPSQTLMKFLFLFFCLSFVFAKEDFIKINLNQPYDFPSKKKHNFKILSAEPNVPVKFEVFLGENPDTKALSIRIVDGFSHPPSCIPNTFLNVTITKEEVQTKPLWSVPGSCTSITSSTEPPFIPKSYYYVSFETVEPFESCLIIVHNLE